MEKADPALVEKVLAAARAVLGDPELQARLVPDAIDDVDPAHLRMRISLFETMGEMQRLMLRAHAMKAEKMPATPSSDRSAMVAAARVAADRMSPDKAEVDALFSVIGGLSDDALIALTADLGKIADAQRADLETLFGMDARAEAKAAKLVEAAARLPPSTPAERMARMKQMQADLAEKTRVMKERLEAMKKR